MSQKLEKVIENQRRIPKQARARAKYEAVLDACSQLLLEKGYHKTTMLELSLVSGVAIPSIYQYFPNKEGVFKAWFERLGDSVFDALPTFASAQAQGKVVDIYISQTLLMLSTQRQSAKTLLNELPGALTTELIQSLEYKTLDFVEKVFSELLDMEMKTGNLLILIRLLLGYNLQLMLHPDRELDIDHETRKLSAMVEWFLLDEFQSQ